VQRHAVHGRRHAVLAHAVMDEAAGIVGGGEHRHALGAGVVGAGEVGGAADHLRHRRGQASSAVSDAARVAISFGVAASFSFADAPPRRAVPSAARRACGARIRRGGAGGALSRSFQALMRGLARAPALAPQRKDIGGNDEAGSASPVVRARL
jgi:hypothetical protein